MAFLRQNLHSSRAKEVFCQKEIILEPYVTDACHEILDKDALGINRNPLSSDTVKRIICVVVCSFHVTHGVQWRVFVDTAMSF